MALEERRVARTSVLRDEKRGLYTLGSGYLIADGLVLTAAHVLQRAEGVSPERGQGAEVAMIDGTWHPGAVAWVDTGLDVAVLDCRRDGHTPPGLRAGGTRWGRLAGADPLEWGAVGFPAASRGEGVSGGRQAEHAFGRTSAISEHQGGRLALTVDSREATQGESPWAGLSGAAVFCGDYLVGVVITDPGSYGRSLDARRVEAFATDPEFAALLGGAPLLEEVAGRPREPGLANLRSTLKSRDPFFTGREEDLAALIPDPDSSNVITQGLVGFAGAGKSALAREHAHRLYGAGKVDLAWWFEADDRQLLETRMAAHYRSMINASGSAGDDALTAVELRNWLGNCPYRWVLIFDEAQPGTLDGILPERGHGQVIVTSRSSDWPGLDSSREIGPLPTADAAILLARIGGFDPDLDTYELAEELGRIPLNLVQAGDQIRRTHFSCRDYVQALRAEPGVVPAPLVAVTPSRLIRTLTGHALGVTCVAFSPDGRLLATGSIDSTARLWGPATGQHLRTLDGANASEDGPRAALRDTLRFLKGETGPGFESVNAVAFSPDGRLLATGDAYSRALLWDPVTGQLLRALKGHTNSVAGVVFSPGGDHLATASGATVRLWDPASGKHLLTIEGHTGNVNGVAFSPGGRLLATASSDSTVRLWDPASGQHQRTLWLWGPDTLQHPWLATGERLDQLEASREEQLRASSPQWARDRLLRSPAADAARAPRDQTILQALGRKKPASVAVRTVAFSPDGRLLATGCSDSTVRLWDPASGQPLHVLEGHTNSVNSVAFRPGGRLLATGSADSTVRLWDGASGQHLQTLEGQTGHVNGVAFSPDGRLLATASFDSTVRLWS
jgi:WD40 repeat protein